MPNEFTVRTHSQEEFIDITNSVKEVVTSSHIQKGVAVVYVPIPLLELPSTKAPTPAW